MTAIQSNKLAMYHAVRVFLGEFLNSTTATSLFPALAAKQASLITLIDHITSHALTQDEPLGAAIAARERALANAMTAALEVAGSLLSYARTQGAAELSVHARVSASAFHALRRADRMRLAQRLHDLALPLTTELADYGVTAAKLTALQALIDTANTAVHGRTSVAAAKKVATAEIERLCAEADTVLVQIDPMLVQLGRVDPETYAGYRAARTVFDRPGTRSGHPETLTAAVGTVPHVPLAAAPDALAERKAA